MHISSGTKAVKKQLYLPDALFFQKKKINGEDSKDLDNDRIPKGH